MKFIKILFWTLLVIFLVIFSVNNWQPVTLSIGLESELITKLPVIVIGSLIIGFVPLYIWHNIVKWRLKRKINNGQITAPAASLNNSIKQSPKEPLILKEALNPKDTPPNAPQNAPINKGGISPLEPKTTLNSD